ncbi:MAG: hypothetical protein ABSE21_05995 [Bryobacteraceae bacterium]
MKRTVLLSFLALCLPAVLRAQTPVTITGPINTPEGQPWTGTLSIQNPTVICGGVKVPQTTTTLTVTAGIFQRQLNLYPIADCGFGGYSYAVRSIGFGANRPLTYWVIHSSSAPETVAQVEVLLPPAIAAYVLPPAASGVLGGVLATPNPGGQVVVGINSDGSLNYAASTGGMAPPGGAGLTYWTGSAVRVATYLDLVALLGTGATAVTNLGLGSQFQASINGAPGAWPSFAPVATSGNYADLSNKPIILTDPLVSAGDFLIGGAGGIFARLANPGNGTWCINESNGTVTLITCPGAGGSGLTYVGLTMPAAFTVSGPLMANGTIAVSANGTTLQYIRGDGTVATFPTTWPWSALSSVPSTFAPSLHASTHAAAGSDPLSLSASQIGSGYPYGSLSGAPTIPAASSATPAMDGTAAAGSSASYSRADHVHPTDTSRQAAFGSQGQNSVYAGPATGGSGAPTFRALVSADIPNNAANTSGNASTATALASTPTPCSAGNFPLGIAASGNATGCTPAATGTVTNNEGAFTPQYLLIGNGGPDAKVSTPYLDSSWILNNPAGFKSGGAGSGFVQMGGATSGAVTVTVQSAAGSWTLTLPNTSGVNGQTWVTDGNGNMSWYSLPTALPPNGSASGDLSGSYPNPMVAQIGGAALPASGSITKTNSSGQLVAATAGTDYVLPAGSITGNASTATALASTPTTCAAGNYPLGISANGNVTGCTAATGGGGTVTSVTFTGDGTLLSATASAAVTSSGTLTAALKTQTKNTALMGPSSGSATNPTFRTITAPDLPTQTLNYWFPGTVLPPTNGSNQPIGGTGLANTVRFIIFTLPFNTTISKASVDVTTIDASQTADFGIYNSAGTSKLWSIGSGNGISLGTSAVVAATNTTVTLAAGSYLFAWTESGTVGNIYTWNMNTGLYQLLASGSSYKYGTCTNTATAGVLPASCGTLIAATAAFNVAAIMLEP